MKKRFSGVCLLLGASALASLAVFGGANADWTTPDGSGSASTESEVATDLWCTWYATGFASSIALSGEEGAEYEGEAFALSGEDTGQAALVSGWSSDAAPSVGSQDDCSWYNAEKGLKVTITADGGAFVSSTDLDAADNSLGWSLAESALAVTFSEDPDGACSEDWELASGLTIAADNASVDAAEIAYSATMATNESCSWDTAFSTSIPAGQEPASPGATYSFVGPTLETSLQFNSAP